MTKISNDPKINAPQIKPMQAQKDVNNEQEKQVSFKSPTQFQKKAKKIILTFLNISGIIGVASLGVWLTFLFEGDVGLLAGVIVTLIGTLFFMWLLRFKVYKKH